MSEKHNAPRHEMSETQTAADHTLGLLVQAATSSRPTIFGFPWSTERVGEAHSAMLDPIFGDGVGLDV